MRFVSIDIETSGLDPNVHGILEIAAVAYDFNDPKYRKQFHCFVEHTDLTFSLSTLELHCGNGKGLKYFLHGEPRISVNNVMEHMANWARKAGLYGDGKMLLGTGKNFAGFDLQFLKKLPFYPDDLFHYRTIDIGTRYFEPIHKGDGVPPSLKECLKRSGIPGTVKHSALEDAEQVAELVHKVYNVTYPLAERL